MMILTIFQPVCVLALHTLIVLGALGMTRSYSVKNKKVSMRYYQEFLGDGESGRLRLLSRNYINLLESPVLFYVAVVIIYMTNQVDDVYIYFCWGYVVCRILHTLIHVFYNNVNIRFAMFGASIFHLTMIWVRLSWNLFR